MTPNELIETLRKDRILGLKFGQLSTGLKLATERQHFESLVKANPEIAACTIESIRGALLDVAVLGLTLSPAQRLCYLIPASVKAKNAQGRDEYQKVLTAMPSYIGLEQAVLSTGSVLGVQTQLVYDTDSFEVYGTETGTKVRYAAGPTPKDQERDARLRAVYCIAQYENKFIHVEVMDREDILGCRAAAEKKQGRVPFTWTGPFRTEMWKKCAVRRAAKHWPRTARLGAVLDIMDRGDPMDFKEPEPNEKAAKRAGRTEPGPSAESRMREALVAGGIPESDHAKWLTGIAGAMGRKSAADLPASAGDDAVRRIRQRIEKLQAAQLAQEAGKS